MKNDIFMMAQTDSNSDVLHADYPSDMLFNIGAFLSRKFYTRHSPTPTTQYARAQISLFVNFYDSETFLVLFTLHE